MHTPTIEPSTSTATTTRERITALDVVRGFALCGILLVNVRPIADSGVMVSDRTPDPADALLDLFTQQRFFPIFSLLFGIGFALLHRSAAARTTRPRLVLLRRLLSLLALGALHFLLWPGDILTTYALVGLLVLLPATWLPRWVAAAAAPVLIAAALILGGQRLVLVAGLFLLGSALVGYGVIDRIEKSTRVPLALAVVFAALAAPLLWYTATTDLDPTDGSRLLALTGLLLAGFYVCALLMLLRSGLRRILTAMFAPLGKMALTNYLAATLIVTGAAVFVPGPARGWSTWTVVALAAGMAVCQWVWSTLWLRRFRQGPAELLWRRVTWWQRTDG